MITNTKSLVAKEILEKLDNNLYFGYLGYLGYMTHGNHTGDVWTTKDKMLDTLSAMLQEIDDNIMEWWERQEIDDNIMEWWERDV